MHKRYYSAMDRQDWNEAKQCIQIMDDVDYVYYRDWTHLTYALYKNRIDIVDLLISRGAYVDRRLPRRNNRTPLIFIADIGFVEGVDALLRHGAEINAKDRAGLTALMIAAENGFTNIIGRLIAGGADCTIKSKIGKTALDFAKEPEAKTMLERYAEQTQLNLSIANEPVKTVDLQF